MGAVQGCLGRGNRDIAHADPVHTSGVTSSGLISMDYGERSIITENNQDTAAASKTIGSVTMFMDTLTQRAQQRITPLETSPVGKISVVSPVVSSSVTGGESNTAGSNSIWTWN